MSGDTLLTKDTDFVMLRRYRDLPEAVIVKSILDAEGIDCVLSDENLVRMDWFWSNLLGGVKLWVRQQDLEDVKELIDQNPPENFDVEGVGAFSQPHCPQCQSIDISFRELNKRVAFVSAYFGLPIPLKRRGWKCHACGHLWQDPSGNEHATVKS
jgi:Putative prokaryotic signal transducing protein